MKKNIKHILPILFVLSLGFVSCSQMELDVKEETLETTEETVWTLKVEAGAKGDADTKALSMNPNGTIKSEWVQNDVIIAYKYLENGMLYLSEPVGSLTAETSGLHTTFTGSLTSVEGLAVGTKIRLTYPNDQPDYFLCGGGNYGIEYGNKSNLHDQRCFQECPSYLENQVSGC